MRVNKLENQVEVLTDLIADNKKLKEKVDLAAQMKDSKMFSTDWIYENLTGRFWLGDYYYITESGSIAFNKRVAFEIPAEASYFGMFLDQINKYNL